MACPEANKVRQLLVGSLDSQQTLVVMNHTRSCDECQDQLKTNASRAVRHSSVEGVSGPRPALRTWSPGTSTRTGNASGRRMATRRLFLLSGAIVVFALWQMRLAGMEGEAPLTADEIVIQRALSAGLPWAETPHGPLRARPKVTAVLLPEGTREFTVHYVARGVELHSHTWAQGDAGAQFDAVERRGEEGKYPAVSAVIPFPKREAMALEQTVPVTWYVMLPNGHESPPRRFELAPKKR